MNCIDAYSQNLSFDLSTVFFDFCIIFIILKTTLIIHNTDSFHHGTKGPKRYDL
jgi:hypothetical protein